MSHSVTIQTRTVTTGSPSAINTTFCRSWTGILKLAQVALGIVSVGLSGYVISHYFGGQTVTENLFFILIATTFMIASFLLVLSCLCSYTTESIISKTIFELLFHAFAFALLLAASVTLLTKVTKGRYYNRTESEKLEMGAAICGLINATLYLISTIFALRTSRGL
ncbi:PREDICTED: uncharacterized protein LOC105361901 isoform X1 [Ceratosolen solmsi marchali]|uniref:Uncharacterized protein LOC105361901 isoform X1 n=1 Tax=Ceratosolen solmsi marchali TaxID=326594 RepID=A0AAJ6YG84_9HYME|nr:PREDICTED: uncharacterized protein LOC105361901 isoform X1 [Ceratosolen solmsi marchali]XP_011497500.1 PREDICTED: uncharacterized protein LOC105361901 isoform X1 [Ceratosolen solmsi marchali]XP_011497502.1 PREDICTED: uncharacterized protein LOC105361901 isoform X1 [Ceratosolen solmsi marchali]XP_011497503.1 PREDICTED: uncharacterized protein LOC105361901 isoform X1 [Ceratosolen solmsi marchali]XP_011497504.1 PREDICTED: uncharacterized protein LOC105361901 isoform X1 [Ceratosolen solmsi march